VTDIKLTQKEADELRTRQQMLNEATLRVGQIDLAMAELEGQRHQARTEAMRQTQELRSAAERAGTAHGIVNPIGWKLDIQEGVLRSNAPSSSATVTPIRPNGKKNGHPQPR